MSKIQYTTLRQLSATLQTVIGVSAYSSYLLITDENIAPLLPPLLQDAYMYIVPSGEQAKQLSVAKAIWMEMLRRGFDRHSCIVAVGGGVVTDLAGWVAASYMRGVGLINVPTTLLGMVDASIGGKCGINIAGAKNMVGTFYPATEIVVAPEFLHTLPAQELLSGYGEVLKYALLDAPETLRRVTNRDPQELSHEMWSEIVTTCIAYKTSVVATDLYDTGIRQHLNLGHTTGHALEAYAIASGAPIPHGIAVAAGLVVESYLSVVLHGLSKEVLITVADYVRDHFPPCYFSCADYDAILSFARKDKKNHTGQLAYIAMHEVGKPFVDHTLSEQALSEALDFYRDYFSI